MHGGRLPDQLERDEMSILVKGMKMPRDCCDCPCHNGENGRCQIAKEVTGGKRPYDCPLIEVPTPHGRLIDPDKLYEVISLNYKDLDSTEDFMGIGYDHCIGDTLIVIRQASTIIEAEDE